MSDRPTPEQEMSEKANIDSKSSYDDVDPHYDPDELTRAFAWRDWQTVEMLMDEQETPT